MRRALAVAAMATIGVGCRYKPAERHGLCPAVCGKGHEMGAIPSELSALRNSEVTVAVDGALDGIASQRLGAGYGGEHLTARAGLSIAEAPGDKLTEVFGDDLGEGAKDVAVQNITASLGFRSFASELGGTYRRGLAVRADYGVDVSDSESARANDDVLVDHRPFDFLRFASGQHFQVMAEARYELIGCHAPFVHLELGVREHQRVTRHALALPLALAIGAHPAPDLTIYGQYQLVVAEIPEVAAGEVMALQMFKVGVEIGELARTKLAFELALVAGERNDVVLRIAYTYPLALGIDP